MGMSNEELKSFIENELSDAINKAVEKAMDEWIEKMLYGPQNAEASFRNDISDIRHASYEKEGLNGNSDTHESR